MSLDILVVLPQPDGVDRTGLLAEAAEYAAQGVDFVPAGIAGAVLPLPDLERDAPRGADGDAQAAGDAGGLPGGVLFEIVDPPPAGGDGPPLLRILDRNPAGRRTS